MHYLGGKMRTGKAIAWMLDMTALKGYRGIIEPFCGGAWVTSRIRTRPLYASDFNKGLISMYKALQQGWVPPTSVDEDEYNRLKALNDLDDPLTAFVGYGCSWGGKYFSGYARDGSGIADPTKYAAQASRSCVKKAHALTGVEFAHRDYRDYSMANNWVIYCDPPYANTTQAYGKANSSDDWNPAEFWAWAEKMAERNAVFVSEYTAPEGWEYAYEINTWTSLMNQSKVGSKERTDGLWTLRR